MKHKSLVRWVARFIACCCCGWMFASLAGTITIQKSSEITPGSPDPWQIKQEILEQNQWREWLKTEQGINLLYQLPVGCVVLNGPQPRHLSIPVYHCFGRYYRPYTWQNQDVFVEVVPPTRPDPGLMAPVISNPNAPQKKEKGSNKP